MNLPNKITAVRIALIPVFAVLALLPSAACHIWAAAVFALASFSDAVDGRIARSRNLVTNLGKFIDPLADKMLVMTALVILTGNGSLPAWVTVLVLCRDFAVDGLRFVAAEKGVVIAASKWGKRKTAVQMMMVILLLLLELFPYDWYLFTAYFVTGLALVLTLYSGFDYLRRGREFWK